MTSELPIRFSGVRILFCRHNLKALKCLGAQILGLLWYGSLFAQDEQVGKKFREATEAMRTGRLEDAAERFFSIVQTYPAFAESHLNLGLVRAEQGKNEEAIASFQKALTIKPRLRGANLFLGIAEYRLNNLDKAISAL